MNLPLMLGKAGKAHNAIQYRNANTTKVEDLSWTEEEEDRQEMAAYTTTTVVGSATMRGPDDMMDRSDTTKKQFRKWMLGIAVRKQQAVPFSWTHGDTLCISTGLAWRIDRQQSLEAIEDLAVIKTSIMDIPDEAKQMHCLSAFLWKIRRGQSEGSSQTATLRQHIRELQTFKKTVRFWPTL